MKKLAFIIGTGDLGPIALNALPTDTYNSKIFALPDCPPTHGFARQIFDLDNFANAFAALAEFAPDIVCIIGGVKLTASHRQQFGDFFRDKFGKDSFTDLRQAETHSAPDQPIGDQIVSLMLVKTITSTGAKLTGIHQLAPDLITPQGQIGTHLIAPDNAGEIDTAISLCLAHARADKGQAIITQNGVIVEKEDHSGTAAMLVRHAATSPPADPMTILVKCARPNQPLTIDMPTIGPDTIDQAITANIKLIILEAQRSLMIDKSTIIAKANAANIAILGVNIGADHA